MPRTRGESIFFTAIIAWMMVYAMILYNTVLATGVFTNRTIFSRPKRDVDRIYNDCITCIFCIEPSCKNMCISSCSTR